MSDSLYSTIVTTCNLVRKWMVEHYGEGINLAGHCIEASDLIVDILGIASVKGAQSVEGWVTYDDDMYSIVSYDPHTWVEVHSDSGDFYYIDVTADQFNYGMDFEFKFSGVTICFNRYPHGVIKEIKRD